jgi:acyl-coenzyme A synthetase/AMP-(fatty) acid ligase
LIAFGEDHVASTKKRKSLEFVDELPKNNCGKILKKDMGGL